MFHRSAQDAFQRLDAARALILQSPRLSCGAPCVTFGGDSTLQDFLDIAMLLSPTESGSFRCQYLNETEAARCAGYQEGCDYADVTVSSLQAMLFDGWKRMLKVPALRSLVGVAADRRTPGQLLEIAGFDCPISANGRAITHVARFFTVNPAPRGSIERIFLDVTTPLQEAPAEAGADACAKAGADACAKAGVEARAAGKSPLRSAS